MRDILEDDADGMYSAIAKKRILNEIQDLFVGDAPCIREQIHATILPTFATTPTYQRTRPLSTPVMVGGGLNDFAVYGLCTRADIPSYAVTITVAGTPDKFQWEKDAVIQAGGISITGGEQLLENGIYIKFTATTGHTAGNAWSFTPLDITIAKDSDRGDGVFVYKVSECIGIESILRVDSAAADDVGPRDERKLAIYDEDWLDTLTVRESAMSYPAACQLIQPDKFILWVHPAVTDDLTIEICFRRRNRTLVGDNDIPLIPAEFHRALPYGAGAMAWERKGQTGMADMNWKLYNPMLAEAIRQYNCKNYRPKPKLNPRYF